MAHFAQLDENNIVTQVVIVSNQDTSDVSGNEVEEIGIAFCKTLFGDDTHWKQTSYTGSIRVRYAGVGYSYNQELDAFVPPKPYPSWILDETTVDWKAPTPMPDDEYSYKWNEKSKTWKKV